MAQLDGQLLQSQERFLTLSNGSQFGT